MSKVWFAIALAALASAQTYRDPHARTADRVKDLLGRMTVEEKVAQLESALQQAPVPGTALPEMFGHAGLNAELAKKTFGSGLGTFAFLDEFNGLADLPDGIRTSIRRRNLIQDWVLHNTRLGIPVLFHGEALHGAVARGATSFPQAVALGSTWDPALIETMFNAVAGEARAAGNAMVLAPVLDLSRDPRFGRTEEMYGEDPYLVARLGEAAIRGLQGTTAYPDERHVFSTAKHFLHGQPENGTNDGPADLSEHTLRAYFMTPFERAVRQAKISAVMPSYNETLGGIPSSVNSWLLKKVLRGEWGFQGLIVSDYGAVEQLASTHHVAADINAAGIRAFEAGLDVELPSASGFPALVGAVKSGRVAEQTLDEAVARMLTMKFEAGLFEHPMLDEQRAAREVGTAENSKLARKVADEAVVLLQNKGGLLPLDASKIQTLAVIGPNANKVRLGTYSGIPKYFVTVLDSIRARASGTKVVYAEGCRISEPDRDPDSNAYLPYEAPSTELDRRLMDEAVEAARSADVVVLAIGGNETVSRESLGDIGMGKLSLGDSDTLELPGRQNELVERVAKVGKPTVAVLLNGKAYAIGHLMDKAAAIVEGWYLGQETGNAIADVLFGDVNPSGRLPVTIARNVGQLPVFYYKTPAARRGYVLDENTPLFPFGFGLSYTSFRYGTPRLNRAQMGRGDAAKLSVTVTNTGSRAGDEVVQLYVHHPVSSMVQPVELLRGFERVHLEAGASVDVTFAIGSEQLSILNEQMQWVMEPGVVDLLVGPNSTETTKVSLTLSE